MKKYLKLDIKKFKDIKDESRGRASEEFSELITVDVFYIDDEGAIHHLYVDEFHEKRKQGVDEDFEASELEIEMLFEQKVRISKGIVKDENKKRRILDELDEV